MYLRDAPLRPLHLSSSPLSSATTFLLGLGILLGLGVVIANWPIFVAAGIAFGAFLAARAAVRRHRRRQRAHAAIAARADFEHAAIMRGNVEQLSIPVDQDLLRGLVRGRFVVGAFDEFAVLESSAGADQCHQVGRVHSAPA